MGRTACTEPQCLYKGDLYIYLLVLVYVYLLHIRSGIAQSVQRLATGLTVRESNPGGGTRPDRPAAHSASYTMGTRSFPGGKRPGCGVDHTTSSRADVKERVQLHLYSNSEPSWTSIG